MSRLNATVGRFRGTWIEVPAVVVAAREAVLAMVIVVTVALAVAALVRPGAAAPVGAVTDAFLAAVGRRRGVRVEFAAVVGAAHKAAAAVAIVVAVSSANTARLVL